MESKHFRRINSTKDFPLETRLTPSQRVRLAEELYQEIVYIQKKSWKPFVKSFSSFDEYEKWKAKQTDPRLW